MVDNSAPAVVRPLALAARPPSPALAARPTLDVPTTLDAPTALAAALATGAPPRRNLRRRIVAGAVMAAVTVLVMLAGPVPFALLTLAVAIVMCWEWGRVVRGADVDGSYVVHVVAVALAVPLAVNGHTPAAWLVLVAGSAAVLVRGRGAPILSAVGVLYVGGAAVALVGLRSDPTLGLAAVLYMMLVVWTTDTMAFVVGRAIGGAKLWPSISPNKTWAGCLGGATSATVVGGLVALAVPGASTVWLALLALALSVVAQAGDLAESALKRRFGVKDASDVIPGHGGVMDRMDGIVAVALVSVPLTLAIGGTPAVALLGGGW